jgi:hypothetical protein
MLSAWLRNGGAFNSVFVIAFDSESFQELMNTYTCGELINLIDEILLKVEKLINDYDSYKEEAFMAFKQVYDFDENFNKFIHGFDDFIEKECGVEKSNSENYVRYERILDEDA